MNWGKLKNFLIGLFLFINIFLITDMILGEKIYTTIPAQTIQDTINILERNDILINQSVIPTAVKNMNDITVKPVTKSDNFSGKISENDGNMFEMNISQGIQNATDMKNVLSKAGIKDYNVEKSFADGYARLSQQVDGYNIFESTIEVASDGNKTILSGEWYDIQSKPKKDNDYENLVILPSILVNYVSNEQRPIGEQEITDIQYGYYVENTNTNAIVYTAVPCWMIEVDNAMNFYYNARNGEYIEMLSFQ